MAHDVFISYSSKDKPIADGICANLEAAGLRCWIAPRDIGPGEEWPKAITNAIAKSQVMVLVFSSNSNASSDVGREIVLAASHNLIIIPFKIENVEPEPGKQYYLAQTHWLEAMNPPTKAQIRSLVDRVRMIIPPLETNAIVQPEPVLPTAKEQPGKPAPDVKRNWFRREYLWIGLALLLVALTVIFGSKLAGTPANPAAPPTLAATETSQPDPTGTVPPTIPSTLTPNPTTLPTTTPGLGSTRVRYRDEMVMVFVPAGDFIMGSDHGDPDEQPVHTVSLEAFWIDQTEVTNAMFLKCVIAGICSVQNNTGSSTRTEYFRNSQYDEFPMINLSWEAAEDYCKQAGARLPSEAEWEKAARGTDGRTYPWGNESPDETYLNFNMNVKDTVAVGSYPLGASPYGALDMAGNVWEYVADYYGATYYSNSPASNPTGPVSGNYRVIRGGAGNSYAGAIRTSSRDTFVIRDGDNFIGFRCADSP